MRGGALVTSPRSAGLAWVRCGFPSLQTGSWWEQLVPVISASINQRKITVAALVDTATLWKWGGPGSPTSTPLLAAAQVELGSLAAPPTGLLLRQPSGAPPLQLGSRPLGFWNGAAVLAGGQIYLAMPTMVVNDRSSSSYSRRPAVAWVRLAAAAQAAGTGSCPQSQAGREAAKSADWTADYSSKWAAEHAGDREHSTEGANTTIGSMFEPRLVGAASAGGAASKTVIKAAFLKPGALLLGAAASAGMTLYGGRPCSCYACYWGGEYFNYGGYVGGNLGSAGTGYQGFGYRPTPGRVGTCDDTCTRCWYFGYPGNGFGNRGSSPDDPYFERFTADVRDGNGMGSARPPGDDGPTLGQPADAGDDAAGAYLASLFTPCNRSASLTASVQAEGVVSQGGARPLGLVFPAVAVAPGGQLLVVFSFAGPGNATAGGAPAYSGVGAAFISPDSPPTSSSSSNTIRLLKLGKGTIQPTVPPGISSVAAASSLAAGWAELSSAALHGPSGRVFTAVPYAAKRQQLATCVGSWVSSWVL
ncbi:hypothetical protein COO60DRAFT_411664 [Scenedesmus sp. NREL 46B-D3]|nr:hypothetical protein COO60DRAFT_411664 [Scenedesmus sp. NREL 46B-D3]